MDQLQESYGTLSQTINGLILAGYSHDFNVQEECLVCHKTNISLKPEEFQIDKVYRFEGESNPDDEAVIYAISSPVHGLKGTVVSSYGTYWHEGSALLVEKLRTHPTVAPSEIKANEATELRPEGDRILDAPLVQMDTNKFIEKLIAESTWVSSDRNSMTIFKSDTMRIVLLGLHREAELKPHKANGVLSVQVLNGRIIFKTDTESCTLSPGQMIALHPNIQHSVHALEDSFFLLTLSMQPR